MDNKPQLFSLSLEVSEIETWFMGFAVNGPTVEVSVYHNSDMVSSNDVPRDDARFMYRVALNQGYKPTS